MANWFNEVGSSGNRRGGESEEIRIANFLTLAACIVCRFLRQQPLSCDTFQRIDSGQDRRLSVVRHCRFGNGYVDLDLGRCQKSVVNQAVVHGAHETFRLVFRQGDGAYNMDAEVAYAGWLFQLVGGHGDFHAAVV